MSNKLVAKDITNNQFHHIESDNRELKVKDTALSGCIADGKVKVDIEDAEISGTGLATEPKQDTMIANQTNGTSKVQVLGNEEGDGSGTARHIHTDGSGNVLTSVVNTINTTPANSANSHITDDPTNTFCVGLKGRTTIGTATTETFLLCDSDGHLQVDVLSGGGTSDATAANQSTMITKLGEIDTACDLTNTKLDTIDGVLDNILTKNTEIDTAVDAMSAKLPASLGAKATSTSLSVARSTTTGDWDLSARTTIATKGTSTKLLCNSAGELNVEQLRTQNTTTIIEAQTIADSASSTSSAFDMGASIPIQDVGHTLYLTNSNSVNLMIEPEVSNDNTNWFPVSSSTTTSKQYIAYSREDLLIPIGSRYFRIKFTNNDGLGNSTDITCEVEYWN